jgi:hypothetical protein
LLLLLLLMFDFELFVALGRYLNLIANSVIDLRLALGRASNDLISEYSLINDTVEGTRGSKKLIINIRVFGRVDSNKVTSLLILRACLPYKLPVSQCDSFSHSFMNWGHIVLGILSDIAFDHLQQVCTGSL